MLLEQNQMVSLLNEQIISTAGADSNTRYDYREAWHVPFNFV